MVGTTEDRIQQAVAVDIDVESLPDDLLAIHGPTVQGIRKGAVALTETQGHFRHGSAINISSHAHQIGTPIAINIAQLGFAVFTGNRVLERKWRPRPGSGSRLAQIPPRIPTPRAIDEESVGTTIAVNVANLHVPIGVVGVRIPVRCVNHGIGIFAIRSPKRDRDLVLRIAIDQILTSIAIDVAISLHALFDKCPGLVPVEACERASIAFHPDQDLFVIQSAGVKLVTYEIKFSGRAQDLSGCKAVLLSQADVEFAVGAPEESVVFAVGIDIHLESLSRLENAAFQDSADGREIGAVIFADRHAGSGHGAFGVCGGQQDIGATIAIGIKALAIAEENLFDIRQGCQSAIAAGDRGFSRGGVESDPHIFTLCRDDDHITSDTPVDRVAVAGLDGDRVVAGFAINGVASGCHQEVVARSSVDDVRVVVIDGAQAEAAIAVGQIDCGRHGVVATGPRAALLAHQVGFTVAIKITRHHVDIIAIPVGSQAFRVGAFHQAAAERPVTIPQINQRRVLIIRRPIAPFLTEKIADPVAIKISGDDGDPVGPPACP